MVLTSVIIIINGGKFETPLLSLCFVEGLIDGLSTASIDSLYGNLKAVRRPLDIKHGKVAFKDGKN